MKVRRLLITCEHGSNRIPPRYTSWFRGKTGILASHAAFDLGALDLARCLARRFEAPLHGSTVSRLLVDLNRSIGHPRSFSADVAKLDAGEKRRVLERYYLPHRKRIEERVREWTEEGDLVLHAAVHSFVPKLNGVVRRADVAFLYDPKRRGERRFAQRWAEALHSGQPSLRVRLNYPYRGTSDGLTTFLRRRFDPGQYWGIEVEVNQKHLTPTAPTRRLVRRVIGDSLARALGESLGESR